MIAPRNIWTFWRKASQEAEMGAVLYYSALHAEKARHEHLSKAGVSQRTRPPSPPGTLNGKPFKSIRDADPEIGARLESYAAGAYLWIPFQHIASIADGAPKQSARYALDPGIRHDRPRV